MVLLSPGAGGGAILTGIVGTVMKAMNK